MLKWDKKKNWETGQKVSVVGRSRPPFSIHLLFSPSLAPFSSFLALSLHTCLCPRLLRLSAWLNAGVMVREPRFQALGSEQGCRGRRTSIFKAMASYCVKAVCQYAGKSLPAQASEEPLSTAQHRGGQGGERELLSRWGVSPPELPPHSAFCPPLSHPSVTSLSALHSMSSFSFWASGVLVLGFNTSHL